MTLAALSAETRVRLRTGYRLQWEPAQQAHVLLYPEGMVQLNPSAAEILKRCDGRSLAALLADLQVTFPKVELEADVREFIVIALDKGWLDAQ